MSFNPRQLSVIGYANGFTLWHYVSADPLASPQSSAEPPAILAAGYFDAARALLRPGDFVLVNGGSGHAVAVVAGDCRSAHALASTATAGAPSAQP